MSYLNAEQDAHMREVTATPAERVSWCGWGYVADAAYGACGDPGCPCRRGLSLADRRALTDERNA